jgi:hypothetical protein
MWWYGLVVWRVGEIVIFFCLFAGGVGNCDFVFAKLGMDVCKQTFLLVLFPAAPLQKAVSGCWTQKLSLYRNTCWLPNVVSETSWSCSLIHAVPELESRGFSL